MENENAQSAASRTMVATEINSDGLILEEPATGLKISWPLNNIPKPLALGNELNLILQSAKNVSSDFSCNQTDDTTKQTKEAEMRKMLENLVN